MTVGHTRSGPSDVERLVAECNEPLGSGGLAKRLDWNAKVTRFRRVLSEAVADGALVKRDDGLYERR